MRVDRPGSADVLFVAYGGGHVTMLEPVARAVKAAGYTVAFLALTTAQAHLEKRGFDYFGYAELDDARLPDVQAWGRELAGVDLADSAVRYEESVAYHGLNFRDLVEAMGEPMAREHYAVHGRQGFLPNRTMTQLLQTLRPKVVVGTNSPRTERAAFSAAREIGIPAICVVDLFALHELRWISEPNYASSICVLNETIRLSFLDAGCDGDRVVVTGNPAFDALSDSSKQQAGVELRRQRGFTNADKVILWASGVESERHPFTGEAGDPKLPRRIEVELREAVARHADWKLVVRYHPSEVATFMPAQRVYQSTRDEDLHTLLHAVDVVVVAVSTVGLEAYLAGRPVISVDMSVFTPDAPYERMGISRGVTSLDELDAALADALAFEHAGGELSRPPLNATANVAAQVVRLLG